MSVKISELPNITLPDLVTTSSTGVLPIVANTGTSTTTYKTTVSNVKSYIETGNLNVSGAVNANLTSTFANLVITGNLNVQGTTTTTSSENLSTNSSVIDLHTFSSDLDPWTSDDGRDIGLRFFWYKSGNPGTSALVWENDNAYLSWYGTGVGNANTGSISGTLGTMQLGQVLIANSTPTTANATGALQVSGGASIGGNLYLGGTATIVNTASFGSTVNIAGTVTLPNLFVNSSATFGSTISAAGAATLNQLTVNTTCTLNGIVPSGNANANIGATTNQFNTIFAKATSAQYADLAEKYLADADYAPGTVVVFGGPAEITIVGYLADTRVAGVISTDPAYLMNSGSNGLPVALRGKVPVRVVGPVIKGDLLVTSEIPGTARVVNQTVNPLAVFAKSLVDDSNTEERLITAVII